MSDKPGSRGPGSLGTPTNSPVIDSGTSARTQNKPNVPQGTKERDWFKEDVYYPLGARGYRTIRWGAEIVFGDPQGIQLLELWLSGRAPDEVTLDSDDWGDYMRAEPDLQEQIFKKLEIDAHAMWGNVKQSSGRLQGGYESSFHGEVGRKSFTGKSIDGGYLTGYQILHGSTKTDTLKDVQIIGQFTAVRSGAAGSPYTVTYEKLHFVWNDIIDVNARYKADKVLANYAKWENKYTGKPVPKDYTLHIKWEAKEPTTIKVDTPLRVFPNQ
jgi:hypothetical protein